MQRYFDSVQDASGNAVKGATISVFNSQGALASLFSDNGITPLANPLSSDSTGQYAFYAANGTYSTATSAPGLVSKTEPGIVLFDPVDVGTVTPKSFGAKGDGATDDSAAINAAIAAISAAGGGVLTFPPLVFKHNSSIMLASNVTLEMHGATLSWGGGSASQVTSPQTGYLTSVKILGGTIDGGTQATKLLELFSPYHCAFRDVTLKSNSTTNFALDIQINTTGATNPDGNRNAALNEFSNILQENTCGTALRMMGQGPVGGPQIGVVTLNTFVNFNGRGASVRGIDLAEWCDDNYFAGITRVNLTSNNAIGVEWNTATPTGEMGVYANNFDHLAVDTFGVFTGRIGMRMNFCKNNKVNFYFNSPVAEGGAFIVDPVNTQSYYVAHQPGGTGNLVIRSRSAYLQGNDQGLLGVGGDGSFSTETAGIEIGINRTGNGVSYVDLIGDTTYPAYGARFIRQNGGANTSTSILHRGTGNLVLNAQDAGAQILLQAQNGVKVGASNTGLGFFGATIVAQPTTAGAAATFVAGTGTAVQDVSTFDGYTIKQVVKALRTLGLLA